MIIPGDEITNKEIVGKLGDKTLWQISTLGGLHLIEARSSGGQRQIIGAGSHRAVARHIAKKTHPDVEFTALEKSAQVDPRDFEDMVPFWMAVVEKVQKKRG